MPKEQHFIGTFDKAHLIIEPQPTKRGYDKPIANMELSGLVPTAAEVEMARAMAKAGSVITFLDALTVPLNSRNAPLNGDAKIKSDGTLPKL